MSSSQLARLWLRGDSGVWSEITRFTAMRAVHRMNSVPYFDAQTNITDETIKSLVTAGRVFRLTNLTSTNGAVEFRADGTVVNESGAATGSRELFTGTLSDPVGAQKTATSTTAPVMWRLTGRGLMEKARYLYTGTSAAISPGSEVGASLQNLVRDIDLRAPNAIRYGDAATGPTDDISVRYLSDNLLDVAFDTAALGDAAGGFPYYIWVDGFKLEKPANPTATQAAGGSLATGTYYYKVVAVESEDDGAAFTGDRSSQASSEVSAASDGGANRSVIITWNVVNNATRYRIYRGTSSGSQSVYYTVAGGGSTTYTDTGAAATSGTIPNETLVPRLCYRRPADSTYYDNTDPFSPRDEDRILTDRTETRSVLQYNEHERILNAVTVKYGGGALGVATADTLCRGTVAVSATSTTVTGTNTFFLTDLETGQIVRINDEYLTISNIASDTSLTLTTVPSATVSGQTVHTGEDATSIAAFGRREAVVFAPWIRNADTARRYRDTILNTYKGSSDGLTRIEVVLKRPDLYNSTFSAKLGDVVGVETSDATEIGKGRFLSWQYDQTTEALTIVLGGGGVTGAVTGLPREAFFDEYNRAQRITNWWIRANSGDAIVTGTLTTTGEATFGGVVTANNDIVVQEAIGAVPKLRTQGTGGADPQAELAVQSGNGYTGTTTNHDFWLVANGSRQAWIEPSGDLNVVRDLDVGRNISCVDLTETSDERLKRDVSSLSTHYVGRLYELRGVSYYWKDGRVEGEQFGLIAQEVARVYPELVRADDFGNLSVRYSGFIPLLLEAIKAQGEQIEELKRRLAALSVA